MDFLQGLSNLTKTINKQQNAKSTNLRKESSTTHRPKPSSSSSSSSSSKTTPRNAPPFDSTLSKVPVKRIYIACPHSVVTGGPEALHQLCHKINTSKNVLSLNNSGGVKAFMLYGNTDKRNIDKNGFGSNFHHVKNATTPLQYQMYNCPITNIAPILESDMVIWPESMTNSIDVYANCVQKVIWWLSVDNNSGSYTSFDRSDVWHLCQSVYASDYLRERKTENLVVMTEFINRIRHPTSSITPRKQNVVLYNPIKGIHFTDLLIKNTPKNANYTYRSIGSDTKKLTPAEVTNLLLNSKVYIDFGDHPGMDRLPREAALCGCIVVTNKTGSASNSTDVPILPSYKFDSKGGKGRKFNIDAVVKRIGECMNAYEELRKEFDAYREWIDGQEAVMVGLVEEFLGAVCGGKVGDEGEKRKADEVDGIDEVDADDRKVNKVEEKVDRKRAEKADVEEEEEEEDEENEPEPELDFSGNPGSVCQLCNRRSEFVGPRRGFDYRSEYCGGCV